MIEKPIRANVKIIVRAYSKATGIPIWKISKDLYGNAGFIERFFAGEQSIRLSKLNDFLSKLAADWPADTPWPICPMIPMRRGRRGKNGPLSPSSRRAA